MGSTNAYIFALRVTKTNMYNLNMMPFNDIISWYLSLNIEIVEWSIRMIILVRCNIRFIMKKYEFHFFILSFVRHLVTKDILSICKDFQKPQMHASIVLYNNVENNPKSPRRKICVEFYCQTELQLQCQSHLPLATS